MKETYDYLYRALLNLTKLDAYLFYFLIAVIGYFVFRFGASIWEIYQKRKADKEEIDALLQTITFDPVGRYDP